MLNTFLIFTLTFGDSLCGCLQVLNLVHRRKAATFLTSLALGTCKTVALLMLVKSTAPKDIAAYVAGGTLGAQLSIWIRNKLYEHRLSAGNPTRPVQRK